MGDNPFSGFAEGMNQGVSWAAQKNSLELQKQQVDNQRAYQDEIKRQFNVKTGGQILDDMLDVATLPKGPVKKARLDALKQFSEESGIPIHSDWLASLEDENFTPKWGALAQAIPGLKIKNPEEFGAAMEQVRGVLGNKMASGIFEKWMSGIEMAMAANVRAGATVQAAEINAGGRNARAAQHDYSTTTKDYKFVLNGASRALSILDKATNPNVPAEDRIFTTKQVRSMLSNEEARLVTLKSNYGEGTSANMAIDTYQGKIQDFMSKLSGKPEDTVPDEYIQQMRAFYKDLTKEYMEAHDRDVSGLLSGALPAQKKIILNRAKSFQKEYGTRFGGWRGTGVHDESEPPPKTSDETTTTQEKASSPEQVRIASAIYQKYQAMGEGPKKAEVLKKIKQFPKDIKQKLGIE